MTCAMQGYPPLRYFRPSVIGPYSLRTHLFFFLFFDHCLYSYPPTFNLPFIFPLSSFLPLISSPFLPHQWIFKYSSLYTHGLRYALLTEQHQNVLLSCAMLYRNLSLKRPSQYIGFSWNLCGSIGLSTDRGPWTLSIFFYFPFNFNGQLKFLYDLH
jgi:hypothetical protein